MSAGAFESSFYTSDDGTIHPIRIQPETRGLTIGGQANSAPSGPADENAALVRVSGGKRTLGLTPRKIRVRFTGEPPTGYKEGGICTIAVLVPGHFQAYRKPPYQTGTYLGAAIEVVGSSPEGGLY